MELQETIIIFTLGLLFGFFLAKSLIGWALKNGTEAILKAIMDKHKEDM